MSNKYNSLLKDTLLFAISSFVPKALSFFLVPLYTSTLTTYEYGIADMLTTIVSFLIPILTLSISDAVMRFTIENKEDKSPFQVGLAVTFYSTLLLLVIILINISFKIIDYAPAYQIYLVIHYCLLLLYGINMSYLRAVDRVKVLAVTSILNTVVILFSNIVTLLIFKWGFLGYLFSTIFGLFVTNLVIAYKVYDFTLIKNSLRIDIDLCKKMFKYSSPLVAAGIAWWVNSASDRYFVIYFCGLAANGLYSVAYKIPTILQMMQTVFSQAWLLSLYKEYDSAEGKSFVGNIYDIYNGFMCMGCAVLILFSIPFAHILYANDFFNAWKYVPPLLISVVFIANAGFFETMLTLFKKSKTVAATTVFGAIINTIINLILISKIGPLGAAIATALGYFVMWVSRIYYVNELYKFPVNWIKVFFQFFVLIIESYFMIVHQNYVICTILTFILMIINKNVVKMIFDKMLSIVSIVK